MSESKCKKNDPQCGKCLHSWWNMNAVNEDGWCYMFRKNPGKCAQFTPVTKPVSDGLSIARLQRDLSACRNLLQDAVKERDGLLSERDRAYQALCACIATGEVSPEIDTRIVTAIERIKADLAAARGAVASACGFLDATAAGLAKANLPFVADSIRLEAAAIRAMANGEPRAPAGQVSTAPQPAPARAGE